MEKNPHYQSEQKVELAPEYEEILGRFTPFISNFFSHTVAGKPLEINPYNQPFITRAGVTIEGIDFGTIVKPDVPNYDNGYILQPSPVIKNDAFQKILSGKQALLKDIFNNTLSTTVGMTFGDENFRIKMGAVTNFDKIIGVQTSLQNSSGSAYVRVTDYDRALNIMVKECENYLGMSYIGGTKWVRSRSGYHSENYEIVSPFYSFQNDSYNILCGCNFGTSSSIVYRDCFAEPFAKYLTSTKNKLGICAIGIGVSIVNTPALTLECRQYILGGLGSERDYGSVSLVGSLNIRQSITNYCSFALTNKNVQTGGIEFRHFVETLGGDLKGGIYISKQIAGPYGVSIGLNFES